MSTRFVWEWRMKYIVCIVYLSSVYYLLYLCLRNESNRIIRDSQKVIHFQIEIIPVNTTDVITYHTPKLDTTKKKTNQIKNILIWNPHITPFLVIRYGADFFTNKSCEHTNCFITLDKNYLPDLGDFDAVIFSGCSLRKMILSEFPKRRSVKQKYVFAILESAALFPVTYPVYDNFFNWTWTHRLSSDILWRYLTVYDLNGTVIGPAVNIKWPKKMKPISDYTKSKLNSKTKAAAWFVSHCITNGHREKFYERFNVEFKKYGWTVDVFGDCGNISCTIYSETCFKMLERDYHFYLSFENSLEEDYVTEKLLTALNNYAVPVVYGGADYSRFMPPDSYLDARKLGPALLAKVMDTVIRNKTLYYDFFRWRNHFRYESSDNSTDLCNLCAALNNQENVNKTTEYKDFRLWWNGPFKMKTYQFMLKTFLINNALRNFVSTYNYTRENSRTVLEFLKNQSYIPH